MHSSQNEEQLETFRYAREGFLVVEVANVNDVKYPRTKLVFRNIQTAWNQINARLRTRSVEAVLFICRIMGSGSSPFPLCRKISESTYWTSGPTYGSNLFFLFLKTKNRKRYNLLNHSTTRIEEK